MTLVKEAAPRRWTFAQVSQDIRPRVATCFIAVEDGGTTVADFYTLAAASLVLRNLPEDQANKLLRYLTIPVIRLAVATAAMGQGHGGRCSLMRSRVPTNRGAARIPSPTTDGHVCHLLVGRRSVRECRVASPASAPGRGARPSWGAPWDRHPNGPRPAGRLPQPYQPRKTPGGGLGRAGLFRSAR